MRDGDEPMNAELVRYYQEQHNEAANDLGEPMEAFSWEEAPPVKLQGRHAGWKLSVERRLKVLMSLRSGASVKEACADAGITYPTYASWRHRIPNFAAKADEAKIAAEHQDGAGGEWTGSRGSFHAHFFGHNPTWFQLRAIDDLVNMRRGNIHCALWPPEFGKTTTFEDHASTQLALDPSWRFLVAGEARELAQRILGRVIDRMSPMGPTPAYVERFGPFQPVSTGRDRAPWSDIRFNVAKARHSDERDYSMRAVGATSKTVLSSRTDHFHLDDIQSTGSINLTPKLVRWLRQDVFSRAGEDGITTLWGSRIDDGDVWDVLLNDPDLDEEVMTVSMLRAIYVDPDDGETKSIWPEKWSMEALDRQRKKVGQDAFDRNYLMSPGQSTKGRKTFNKIDVEACQEPTLSLKHRPMVASVCYIGLDPSIGGRNCVIGAEATTDNRLIVRRIQEEVGLQTNAQVINELQICTTFLEADGALVTDVVIESMAFQKGLIRDESLLEYRTKNGVSVRDHLTGWNKYDADIGIPSMAKDFTQGRIVLPWADDPETRHLVGLLKSQLYSWKPFVKGNALRQDMVMALWFVWIMWRERWKEPSGTKTQHQSGFKTAGLPYSPTGWTSTSSGLLTPGR